MRSCYGTILAAILLAVSCARARFGALPIPDVAGRADPDKLSAQRKYFSDPKFEGRFPGTKTYELTARYLVQQFSALGLEPAGTEGSYHAPTEYTFSMQAGARTDLGFASGDPDSTESGAGQKVIFTAQGSDYGVAPFSSEGEFQADLLFGGYCSRNRGKDDLTGAQVKAKALLCLRGGSTGGSFRESDEYKVYLARERGAAAVLFISSRSERELPSFVPSPQSEESGLPVYYVTSDLAARSFRLAGQGAKFSAVQQQSSRKGRPGALALEGVRAGGTVEIIREKQSVPGVAGWLHPGTGPAGGPVLVTTALGSSVGSPGDLLEIARVLSGERPRLRRSVLFAAIPDGEYSSPGAAGLLEKYQDKSPACLVHLVPAPERKSKDHPGAAEYAGARTGEGLTETIARLGKGVRESEPDSFFGPEGAAWAREIPSLRASARGAEGLDRTLGLLAALALDPGTPRFREPADFLLGPAAEAVSSRGIIPGSEAFGGGGVRVSGVLKGSPAESAGLRAGDAVVQVAGLGVWNTRELFFALADLDPSKPVEIFYRRGSRVARAMIAGAGAPARN